MGKIASAQEAELLDCPMRDAPFSIDSPFLDVLLSERASAIVKQTIPRALDGLPPVFLRTEAPAFGAIMTVRALAPMAGITAEELDRIDRRLADVEVTDADRRARCQRYDNKAPDIDVPADGTRILVFEKINGFDHGPSVDAATSAIRELAAELGWFVAVTDKGGALTPEFLSMFDAVVWNNNSGDVLTLSQRAAFRDYIESGGAYIGLHGAGGDMVWFWDWYADALVGARFIGHPMNPQFQDARIDIEKTASGIGASLAPGWTMNDEWYSFARSPRAGGADVVATLDESTYELKGFGGQDLRMGDDHPIVWTRCVGKGRAVYSGVGHRAEVYAVPEYRRLLKESLQWAAEPTHAGCE